MYSTKSRYVYPFTISLVKKLLRRALPELRRDIIQKGSLCIKNFVGHIQHIIERKVHVIHFKIRLNLYAMSIDQHILRSLIIIWTANSTFNYNFFHACFASPPAPGNRECLHVVECIFKIVFLVWEPDHGMSLLSTTVVELFNFLSSF